MKLTEFRPLHVRVERPNGNNAASFAIGRDGCEYIDARPEGVVVRIGSRGELPAEEYLITSCGWGVPAEVQPAPPTAATRPR